jgi:hypothetical protein
MPRSDVHLTTCCHSTRHYKISSQANVGGCFSQARIEGNPTLRFRFLATPHTHRCHFDFAQLALGVLPLTTLPSLWTHSRIFCKLGSTCCGLHVCSVRTVETRVVGKGLLISLSRESESSVVGGFHLHQQFWLGIWNLGESKLGRNCTSATLYAVD